jgi:hypothetical protein
MKKEKLAQRMKRKERKMKGNKDKKKCTACKTELDTSPSDCKHSSLVCNNINCIKFAQPQIVIKADNKNYFARPIIKKGEYYATSIFRRHSSTRIPKYAD